MPLPSFTVTGSLNAILPEISGGEIATSASRFTRLTFSSNIVSGPLTWDGEIYSRPPTVTVILGTDGELPPTPLLANDDGLNVEGIEWHCVVRSSRGAVLGFFTFEALAAGETTDLATILGA